jgi:lysophospholipase L1-like esterase
LSYNGNERLFGLPFTDMRSEQVQLGMTRDFMQFVRGLGGIPILASPMPFCRPDAPPSPRIANYEPGFRAAFAAWKAFAEKHDGPVFDLYAILGADEAEDDCRYRDASMTKDGNHPDDEGHALLVDPYLALIKPMLGLR